MRMTWGRWFAAWVMAACLAACGGDDGVNVEVRVLSDLVPGPEAGSVSVALFAGVVDEEAMSLGSVERTLRVGDPLARGIWVTSFPGVTPGTYTLWATLRRPSGGLLSRRPLTVSVAESGSFTITLTADCARAECPSAGGSASFVACLAGYCVDPRCSAETPEYCPPDLPLFCNTDDQCEPRTSCSSASCVDGVCVQSPEQGACGEDEFCSALSGCTPNEPPLGAPPLGEGLCGQSCEIVSETCRYAFYVCEGSSEPVCTPLVTRPVGYPCAIDGICDADGECVRMESDAGVVDAGVDADVADAQMVDAETTDDLGIDAMAPVDLGMDAVVLVDLGVDATVPVDLGMDAVVLVDLGVDAMVPVDVGVDAEESDPCDTDTTPPVATCQPSVTLDLDAVGNGTVDGSWVPVVDNGSTDNCHVATRTIEATSFGCGDVGMPRTVTLTVTDDRGNFSTCQSNVVVRDVTTPVGVDCRDTWAVAIPESGSIVFPHPGSIAFEAFDACGVVVNDPVQPIAYNCADVGQPRTLTTVARDPSDNSFSCETSMMIVDGTRPNVLCHSYTFQYTGADQTLDPLWLDAGSSDNCGIVTYDASQTTFNMPGSYPVDFIVYDGTWTERCSTFVIVEMPPA